jgi:FlaA1/EpsC-like NDP-sugar epimerase
MGATKRLAELVVTAGSASSRKVIVRFGNVLGSSGSVLPIMREAVHNGSPIPLTDPDATRYYMTAAEAVGLVLRADLMARGGEIYWLELGQPVRLGDLAERVLALELERGFAPVAIDVIGLRAGEKRTETLADPALILTRTHDDRLRSARDRPLATGRLTSIVAGLRQAVGRADDLDTLRILTSAVRGFRPSAAAIDEARRLAALSASPAGRRRRAA